ncbi:Carbohydrate kinase FGGY [Nostocoides australiense Ben110]|uniref:Carbohydrate kinase FGGY n=1 Tax=Nostocoides australiense Ben110 TaxID=1193182 RepID=W6K2M7_9MICO|nr:FGGY family carbohydrate kinase [Tetrasphaera australiensis]CCH75345.1 Carbohydrate kinase FGGY [Tetrasphaera australiensis Ben110]
MNAPLVAGLDIGSTNVKVQITDLDGREIVGADRPTPWRVDANGTALEQESLRRTIEEVLHEAAGRLEKQEYAGATVGALAVAGMGESGFVLDDAGAALAPAIAWFDARGAEQLDAFPSSLRAEFAARTGLPLGVQVPVIKLLWLRDNGIQLQGQQWQNVPEYAAAALGGRRALERSLTARLGLIDQDAEGPWADLLAHIGIDASFLPPVVDSATDLGGANADWLPAAFEGARLAVAGHDHLVAATAGGATADGRYYGSFGTAEVLVRVLDTPLSADARARLAEFFINHVPHVEAGRYVLVAGVKTGLIMRRILHLAGITDREARDRLDREVMALPVEGSLPRGAVTVGGARNDDGILALRVAHDGAGPAEVFAAALRHGNDELARLIEAMDRELPPATGSVLAGGWVGMNSVGRARSLVLPDLHLSTRAQDTAYGAALTAARLLTTNSPTPIEGENP